MIIIIDKKKMIWYFNLVRDERQKEVLPMEKKIRHSHQREQIREYLCSSMTHPSAEEIYQALKPRMPELSLGTVYRNLKLLEQMGQIRRAACVEGTERYDACCEDHMHFVCSRCGCVTDVPQIQVQKIRDALTLADGYSIGRLEMTVTGLCPRCQKKD